MYHDSFAIFKLFFSKVSIFIIFFLSAKNLLVRLRDRYADYDKLS